jgi:hypothetical protein
MKAPGFSRIEWLEGSALSPSLLRKSLHNLGLRPGEVFSVRRGSGVPHCLWQIASYHVNLCRTCSTNSMRRVLYM